MKEKITLPDVALHAWPNELADSPVELDEPYG
jgi:hypothetical protein